MLAPLSFLVLLLYSSGLSATRATEECCSEKLTYTDDGRIDEMFVLVGQQQEQSEASDGCEGGCVFVRCLSLVVVSSFLFKLGPEPAFGWLGLSGSSGGYISHALLRAFVAQLGGDRLCFRRLTKHF